MTITQDNVEGDAGVSPAFDAQRQDILSLRAKRGRDSRVTHRLSVLAVAALGVMSILPKTGFAQSVPASQVAPAQSMFAVVEMVQGTVRARVAKDAPWQPATVGMQLPEGAEIRTGVRSAVRCKIEPDQTFVLDRLGTVELSRAALEGGVVRTDLTLKYGRAQYEIEKAGLEHDARITSPGSTLAVRGTIVELEDSPPFRPRATSYTGKARFTADRRTTPVGAAGAGTASLQAGQQNAAINALEASVIDPQNAASRTPADARLIAQQVSLGGVAKFDRNVGITVVKGGAGPTRTEADLVSQLPGQLAFVARWTGNADINLEVGVSKGDPTKTVLATGVFNFAEFVYPGFGLNVTATGGRTDFDHRGGKNGGQEIVYWKGNFPTPATYGIALVNAGGETAQVTFNAFLNGKKLDLYDFAPAVAVTPEGIKSTTYTYTLAANQIAAPLVFLPLPADHPFNSIPDANGGAAADLPDTTTQPPTAAGAKAVTAKQQARIDARVAARDARDARRSAAAAAAKTPKSDPQVKRGR